MLKRRRSGQEKNQHKIKWRVPTKDGWKKLPVDKIPTHHLLITFFSFAKKGYTKIRGVVNNEDAWMITYISELENEIDKRTDIDEYL
jgi:hypothetical protein